jgi:phage head maturation protease
MAVIVTVGPYFGFTLSELEDELERYKEARKKSGSRLASSGVNGQSFGFSQVRADWTLDEWQNALMSALNEINPESYPVAASSNATKARFC